jgi:hypothetical protein
MTVNSRKPTGLPSWPIVVLGGREKAGKTWSALSASTSDLIDHTYYVGIGEDDPDEYSLIPGVDFDIVLHDGTYRGILAAIDSVAAEKGGKPHLLVVDSMTKLWDLIVDNAQAIANKRAKGNRTASGDYAISPDLWNVAANQWRDVMDAIRRHRGPAILTARLDEVMVMENGQPTKDKKWKVQAHKSLVFDAGVVVEMHERGHALITGTKSVRMSMDKPTEAPGFTIAELWDRLGITAESQMGERVHANTQSDDPDVEIAAAVDAWEARAKEQTTSEGLTEVWKDAKAKNVPVEVLDAIRKIAADFQETITGEGKELKKGTRLWLREARAMTAQADVQALFSEAKALGVDESILVQLADMAASLPGAAPAVADEPWAPVDEPPADEDSEGPAAALEDAAVQS